MMKKGALHTLEVFITMILILSCLLIIFSPRATSPEFDTLNIKLKGINAIKMLDSYNELRQYVLINDTESIEKGLQNILQSNINYEVKICDEDCPQREMRTDREIVVNYFIAGNVSVIKPKQIVLYMW